MREKNNVFVVTFVFSALMHIPLYSVVGDYYFSHHDLDEIKVEKKVQPSFSYVPIQREVMVTQVSIPRSRISSQSVQLPARPRRSVKKVFVDTKPLVDTIKKGIKKIKKETKRNSPRKRRQQQLRPTVEDLDLGNAKVRNAFLSYYDLLSTLIGKFAVYPSKARHQDIDGVAYVSFVLLRSGGLGEVVINESSGFTILDKAAISSIQNAAPFPPLPIEIKRDRLRLHVPISFEME